MEKREGKEKEREEENEKQIFPPAKNEMIIAKSGEDSGRCEGTGKVKAPSREWM